MSELESRLESLCRQVNVQDQRILTLAYVLRDQLGRSSWAGTAAAQDCLRMLDDRVLSAANWAIPAGKSSGAYRTAFSIVDAAAHFDRFASQLAARSKLSDDVVRWLVDADFSDPSAKAMRLVARESGFVSVLRTPASPAPAATDEGERPGAAAAGSRLCGSNVDDDWAHRELTEPMVGRDQDLAEHLSFLTLAIRSHEPYLLVGHGGVGKSLFVRYLVAAAAKQWAQSSDPVLRRSCFRFTEDCEFACSIQDARNRLSDLYGYLLAQRHVVPVIDGFDLFLGEDARLRDAFTEFFGAWLHEGGGGRPVLLTARTAPASASVLLRGMRPLTLAALPSGHARTVARRHLEIELNLVQPPLTPDPSVDELANRIVEIAPERYPGRAFPQIAVHLARGVVRRAEGRQLRSEPPAGKVTLDDLYRHVAVEQGISVEVIGKDPVAFYRARLAELGRAVVGQEHAARQVVEHLTAIASSSRPRRLPRGRFLLVGPPGTGKTYLGRMLAQVLGYGAEGFFKYNMSDYGSDGDRWRFQGPPAGYEGHTTRTVFDDVRQRPSCVVLLDEIDRAHPSIQDILLSLLEGEGKDSRNEPVNFSQVIFVMTTNQAQEAVQVKYDAYVSKFTRAGTWPMASDRAALIDAEVTDETAGGGSREWLRSILEQGVTDESDARLLKWIVQNIGSERQAAVNALGTSDVTPAIERMLSLRAVQQQMESQVRKSRLDRAFLDRLDRVIPLFPIKETDLLATILRDNARGLGAQLSDEDVSAAVAEAQSSTETIRPLLRRLDGIMAARAKSALSSSRADAAAAPTQAEAGAR